MKKKDIEIIKLINSGRFDSRDMSKLIKHGESKKVATAVVMKFKIKEMDKYELCKFLFDVFFYTDKKDNRFEVGQIYIQICIAAIKTNKLDNSDMVAFAKKFCHHKKVYEVCVAAIETGKLNTWNIAELIEISGNKKVIEATDKFFCNL